MLHSKREREARSLTRRRATLPPAQRAHCLQSRPTRRPPHGPHQHQTPPPRGRPSTPQTRTTRTTTPHPETPARPTRRRRTRTRPHRQTRSRMTRGTTPSSPSVTRRGSAFLSPSALERRRARERVREQTRPSKVKRGYGVEHQRLRRVWKPRVATGTVRCWRCGFLIAKDAKWHLGHDDVDRSRYRGPEHVRCNAGAPRRRLKLARLVKRASRSW